MKGKSFFSRLFGGGAEPQRPRISSARREELAEELLPHFQKSDPVWDAIRCWEASRFKDKIADNRGSEKLPEMIKSAVWSAAIEAASALSTYGVSVIETAPIDDALWEAVKNEILNNSNGVMLVRSDKRNCISHLTPEERKHFAEYVQKGGTK